MMKEYAAYDNLPAWQPRWEISLHNARDLSWMRQPASDKSSVGHTCWVWNDYFEKYRLVALISLRPFGES
jgi:hypothetical protein